jgi:hypothetical protein
MRSLRRDTISLILGYPIARSSCRNESNPRRDRQGPEWRSRTARNGPRAIISSRRARRRIGMAAPEATVASVVAPPPAISRWIAGFAPLETSNANAAIVRVGRRRRASGTHGRHRGRSSRRRGSCAAQAVGMVPPSMTYSVPVIVPARFETRKAIRLATSFGVEGRPIGMPPSEFMMMRLPPS